MQDFVHQQYLVVSSSSSSFQEKKTYWLCIPELHKEHPTLLVQSWEIRTGLKGAHDTHPSTPTLNRHGKISTVISPTLKHRLKKKNGWTTGKKKHKVHYFFFSTFPRGDLFGKPPTTLFLRVRPPLRPGSTFQRLHEGCLPNHTWTRWTTNENVLPSLDYFKRKCIFQPFQGTCQFSGE